MCACVVLGEEVVVVFVCVHELCLVRRLLLCA